MKVTNTRTELANNMLGKLWNRRNKTHCIGLPQGFILGQWGCLFSSEILGIWGKIVLVGWYFAYFRGEHLPFHFLLVYIAMDWLAFILHRVVDGGGGCWWWWAPVSSDSTPWAVVGDTLVIFWQIQYQGWPSSQDPGQDCLQLTRAYNGVGWQAMSIYRLANLSLTAWNISS